jgi:nitric oxide reductase NorE protein
MSPEENVALAQDQWSALSDLPGHPMMWVLVLCEVVTFGLLFLAFIVARLVQPQTFAAGQALLDPALGGANMLALVTSGWLVARAVEARDTGCRSPARLQIAGAMLLGGAFVALELVEYADKVAIGIGLETDTFFTLYFLITGFHLLHVVMGMAVLAVVAWHDTPTILPLPTLSLRSSPF